MGRPFSRIAHSLTETHIENTSPYFEDFENGTGKFGTVLFGTGTATIVTTTVYADGNALELVTDGTNAAAYSGITADKSIRSATKLKAECFLTMHSATPANVMALFYLTINSKARNSKKSCWVQWNGGSPGWQYRNSSGTFVNIPGANYLKVGTPARWFRVGMVVDIENSKWVNFQMDDEVFDLSSLALQSSAFQASESAMQLQIQVANRAATAHTMGVDNVLIDSAEGLDF